MTHAGVEQVWMNQVRRPRTTGLSPVMVHVRCSFESEYQAHPLAMIRLPIPAKMDLVPPGIGNCAHCYLVSGRY